MGHRNATLQRQTGMGLDDVLAQSLHASRQHPYHHKPGTKNEHWSLPISQIHFRQMVAIILTGIFIFFILVATTRIEPRTF